MKLCCMSLSITQLVEWKNHRRTGEEQKNNKRTTEEPLPCQRAKVKPVKACWDVFVAVLLTKQDKAHPNQDGNLVSASGMRAGSKSAVAAAVAAAADAPSLGSQRLAKAAVLASKGSA